MRSDPKPGRPELGVCESLRSPPNDDPDFEGGMLAPRRITGALKLMLGRFAGGWKDAGSPLGRLACAELGCWTPGGGAIPGAEDMPGGGPRQGIGEQASRAYRGEIVAYLDPAAVPCLGHATHPDRLGRTEERHKEALDGRLSVLANNNASRGCKGRSARLYQPP